jgi:hypothetical protein
MLVVRQQRVALGKRLAEWRVGSLARLQDLGLEDNQLSGTIPAELTQLGNLTTLRLSGNQLSGAIPASIGDLQNLTFLSLHDNMLSGPVPASIVDLGPYVDLILSYNMLEIPEGAVYDYLATTGPYNVDNIKRQTVAPTNVQATAASATSVDVSWLRIVYARDGGYYEVGYATTPGGPYTFVATADKFATGLTLTGLTPGTSYAIVVRTFTPAHALQHNDLLSGFSAEVTVTTPDQ